MNSLDIVDDLDDTLEDLKDISDFGGTSMNPRSNVNTCMCLGPVCVLSIYMAEIQYTIGLKRDL